MKYNITIIRDIDGEPYAVEITISADGEPLLVLSCDCQSHDGTLQFTHHFSAFAMMPGEYQRCMELLGRLSRALFEIAQKSPDDFGLVSEWRNEIEGEIKKILDNEYHSKN